MLDVGDRRVVIVGGGGVAVRKASGLIAAGATRVIVVAPSAMAGIPPGVERVVEPYAPHHLDGADLVFAATDVPAVNDQVVADARGRGIWVCRADSDETNPGDFIVPARFSEGPVTVAVSAGSAALAVAIRDAIRADFDRKWALVANAMVTLRPAVIATPGLSAEKRRAVFHDLASAEAREIVAGEGVRGLVEWATRRHPELSGMPDVTRDVRPDPADDAR